MDTQSKKKSVGTQDNKANKYQILAYKMKTDFAFYSENFLKIRDKKSRLVSFKINEAQKKFQEIIDQDTKAGKPLRYIILKARQLGFSTFTEGQIYWRTTTNEFVNSLIIAHEDKATQNLFAMSKLFFDEFPEQLRPMKKYSNEKALTFENPTLDTAEKVTNPGLRSKITVATAGTNDTARSGTYHNVHISELAFFPNAKNVMTALLQCVPDEPNTLVVLESTANGVGGYFYDMWNDAVAGRNDFTPLFFPWFTDSNYVRQFYSEEEKEQLIKEVNATMIDENGHTIHTEEWALKKKFDLTWEQLNWRKHTIANKCAGDLDMFHQEYPSTPEEAFVASGRPKFNISTLKKYELTCEDAKNIGSLYVKNKEIKFVNEEKGNLKIWENPKQDTTYYIGADVAEGLISGDYSVAIVMDDKLNVVAKWRGHIDPDLFGDELVKLARFYNEAYLAIENNNHGLTTLKKVIQNDYFNLYYTKQYDKITESMTKKLGWSTTPRTKPMMIDKLAEYIREEYFTIQDKDIILELFTYVIDDRGRTNAQLGMHDDCVMAFAITLQAFLEGKNENYVPEIPVDLLQRKEKKNFDIPDIIDPIFEEDENNLEICI